MSKLAVWLLAGFYVAFAVFSVRVKQNVAQAEAYDSFRSRLPFGSPPPDFELADLEGELVTLEQQIDEGELVLINFWATWCGPCRLEIPMLTELDERYREQGLRILAVNVEEDASVVAAFVRDRDVSFPVLLDPEGAITKRYRVEALPTTILVDREGDVIDVTEGLDPYLGYRIEMHLQSDDSEADEL